MRWWRVVAEVTRWEFRRYIKPRQQLAGMLLTFVIFGGFMLAGRLAARRDAGSRDVALIGSDILPLRDMQPTTIHFIPHVPGSGRRQQRCEPHICIAAAYRTLGDASETADDGSGHTRADGIDRTACRRDCDASNRRGQDLPCRNADVWEGAELGGAAAVGRRPMMAEQTHEQPATDTSELLEDAG